MRHGIGKSVVRSRRMEYYAKGPIDKRTTDRSIGQFIRLKPCAKCGWRKINLTREPVVHFTAMSYGYWCERCGFKSRTHHRIDGAKSLWNTKQDRTIKRKVKRK